LPPLSATILISAAIRRHIRQTKGTTVLRALQTTMAAGLTLAAGLMLAGAGFAQAPAGAPAVSTGGGPDAKAQGNRPDHGKASQ
jgi:hypothetical protein